MEGMDNSSNKNGFVFHISKVSNEWSLTSPYVTSLRDLLNETVPKKSLENIRANQEYHFIAKIIYDELKRNKKEINNNCNILKKMISDYDKNKEDYNGNKILNFLFYIFLMNLLNYKKHLDQLDKQKIKKFLEEHNTSERTLSKIRYILLSLSGSSQRYISDKSNTLFEHSLDLLHLRLLLSNEKTRDQKDLINYYLSQSFIENLDFGKYGDDNSRSEILKAAIVIKAASGDGLYLPEPERERYLSSFAKELIKNKYMKNLKDATQFRLKTFKVLDFYLPLWACFGLIFLIEALIIFTPKLAELFSIVDVPVISQVVKLTSWVSNLPVGALIIINGVIVAFLLYLHQKYIYNKFALI